MGCQAKTSSANTFVPNVFAADSEPVSIADNAISHYPSLRSSQDGKERYAVYHLVLKKSVLEERMGKAVEVGGRYSIKAFVHPDA